MNRKHLAGFSLAVVGLAVTGAVATTDLAPAENESLAARPDFLHVELGSTVEPVAQDTLNGADAKAERDRQAAARATGRQLAVRQLAVRRAAARAAAAARHAAAHRASRSTARVAISSGDPRSVAIGMIGGYGWAPSQFGCLDSLWMRESGWRVSAGNSSGAYGIPQALPGSKMASAGSDWQTNARTQIAWGLGYIKGRYGSPCGAWAHFQSSGWY